MTSVTRQKTDRLELSPEPARRRRKLASLWSRTEQAEQTRKHLHVSVAKSERASKQRT